MSITIADLKLRMVEARSEIVDGNVIIGPLGGNLREQWVLACDLIEQLKDRPMDQAILACFRRLQKFKRAGEDLYYAKKHGLNALMLKKLSDVE